MIMKRGMLLPGLLAVFCSCVCLETQAQAQKETRGERAVRFTQTLNEMGFHDYSQKYLEDMIRQYPAEANMFRAQLVETFLGINKTAEATEMIQKIPKDSEAYIVAIGALGINLFRQGKNADAEKRLEMVFEHAKKNGMKPMFQMPIAALLKLYEIGGKADKVKDIIDLLTQSNEGEGSESMKIVLQCMLTLNSAENKKKEEQALPAADRSKLETARKAALQEFLKARKAPKSPKDLKSDDWFLVGLSSIESLEKLQWGGMTYETALAAPQIARAYLLVEEPQRGIEVLKLYTDLFQACDDDFKKQNEIEKSPGAEATLMEAKCNLAIANASKVASDERKFCVRAYKAYGRLLKTYPKHKDGLQSYTDFVAIIDRLCVLDPKIEATVKRELANVPQPEKPATTKAKNTSTESIVPALVEQQFKDKNFRRVIEALEPLMVEKRLDESLPSILNRLLISYLETGDTLSAYTMANYLADLYPASPFTSHALLTAGNRFWTNARAIMQKKGSAEEIRETKDEALRYFRKFLQADIAHANAAIYGNLITVELYNRAVELGKRLNASRDNVQRQELFEQWKRAFNDTIESCDFVLNNFANKPEVIDQTYARKADCYVITDRFKDAAETYRKFCAYGSDNKPLLLRSKMNISDCLYRTATAIEKEARAIRIEAAGIVPPAIPKTPEQPKALEKLKAIEEAKANGTLPAEKPVPADSEIKPVAEAAPSADAKPAAAEAAPSADAKPAPETENPLVLTAAEQKAIDAYNKQLDDIKKLTETAELLKIKRKDRELVAEQLEAEASKIFLESIANLDEMFKVWLKPDTPYAELAKSDKDVQRTIQRAYSLYPWLYDGADTKDKTRTIEAFDYYIRKYPNDKDNIPAFMMRIGVLHMERDDSAKAEEVLTALRNKFPNSQEGKNANFFLARSLYKSGSYTKANIEFKKIFADKTLFDNLSVQNLRWVASNLIDCPSAVVAKDLASYAAKASEKLIDLLKAPADKDWVGEQRASEFAADTATANKYYNQLRQRTLLDASRAELILGDYENAVKHLTEIEKLDKNTPFYYELYLNRSRANAGLKRYDDARKDVMSVSMRATQVRDYRLNYKALTLFALLFLEEEDIERAFGAFLMVCDTAFATDEIAEKSVTALGADDDVPGYLDRALYEAVRTGSLLGKKKDSANYAKLYLKHFPRGKYTTEVKALVNAAAEQTAAPANP